MSPSRFPSQAPYVILFVLCAFGTAWVFGPLLLAPNSYLLGGVGDALKTYYSVAYFARYGSSDLHMGMNYPYGNHPLYLDMHPLLAYVIRGISQQVIDISPYTVGILNLSVMLSFFPCAFFLYKILRHHLLPISYSILFALLITFLSPQINRFSGHLALSYVFFVPMMWYFLQGLFQSKPKGQWLIFYAGAQIVFALIHPYYPLIGAAFFFSYLLVYVIQNRRAARTYRLPLLLAAILTLLPFPMLKMWEAALIGTNEGFVTAPYGFFAYVAGFESIFLPLLEPLRGIWNSVIRLRRMQLEGYAYVGFAGLVLLAFTLYRAVAYARRQQWRRIWRPVLPADLRVAAWAGTLLLIPAMAYPFQLFPELSEWLGPVRQFRSLGRLAWVFYYVYMAYCAFLLHLLYRRLRQRNKARTGQALLLSFCISWGISTWVLVHSQQQFYFQQPISTAPELYADYQSALQAQGYEPSDFQAILALPFYHVGTEKIALPQWQSNRASFGVSLDTGLPLINTKSARMPMRQGLEAIQLVASPLIPRQLPDKFPSDKPLLISYFGSPVTDAESQLLAQAELLATVAGVQLLKLDLAAFATDSADKLVRAFTEKKDSLSFAPPYTYTAAASSDRVIFEGYGDGPGILGESVLSQPTTGTTYRLFEGDLLAEQPAEEMEMSVWVACDLNSNYLPPIDIAVFNGVEQVNFARVQAKESHDYFQGWVRVSTNFSLPGGRHRVVVSSRGKYPRFDHLLIRPVATSVYLQSSPATPLVYNNYLLDSGPEVPL